MSPDIRIEPLSCEAFAPYGDVLEAIGKPDLYINAGKCARYHDLARLDFEAGGRAGISVFYGQAYTLPHTLELVERHPRGSQAFIPMSGTGYLVIVAGDAGGTPTTPKAFLADARQGVNIHRNVWHGVLTPLVHAAQFAVVDWIGEGANVEEYHFDRGPVVRQA